MASVDRNPTPEIGRSRRANEDERLVRGAGHYVGDVRLPGALRLAFVRSVHAHARIRRIGSARAAEAPGVVAVLTAADLPARPASAGAPAGSDFRASPQPLLAGEVVHFVGQPIVVIVAESEAQAVDAAGLVEVDYDARASVIDPVAAVDTG